MNRKREYYCTCGYLSQLAAHVLPECLGLPRFSNILNDTTWNVIYCVIFACASNMTAADQIEHNYSKKRCVCAAVSVGAATINLKVQIKLACGDFFFPNCSHTHLVTLVIRCTAFRLTCGENASPRHVLPQCMDNGFPKNVADIWTSKLCFAGAIQFFRSDCGLFDIEDAGI